jgi:zinc/manganese transport system substrate-binding protein
VRKRVLRAVVAGVIAGALTAALTAGCSSPSSAGTGRLSVVVAENTWGSLASQLGGDRVVVTSIIVNPNTDPHGYEPTTAAARAVATARYVVFNGAGYDPWVGKLLGANPAPGRRTLDIGRLVGIAAGQNPHRWYAPDDVARVIDRITSDYKLLDPAAASYFETQRAQLLTNGLAQYHARLADMKATYAGVAVGASESVFAPLADALGLRLITPASFLAAISEGSEPSTSDKATIDAQISRRDIKVYVFNTQNATPDVQRQLTEARAASIPVVSMTETLSPPGATFQDWQVAQLVALGAALKTATGR